MKQQTMHIQYWKDMLAEAGFKESDIPTTWKAYWDFWCDKVQPAHRSKTGKRTTRSASRWVSIRATRSTRS
jgi:multiple sugar transport system substrate-binding protein